MTLKADSELSERLRQMAHMRREFGKHVFIQIWDVFIKELDKFSPLTGVEAVSQLCSLSGELAAMMIAETMRIANSDDAGVTQDELVNSVTQMIHRLLETKEIKAINKIENKPSRMDIKRSLD